MVHLGPRASEPYATVRRHLRATRVRLGRLAHSVEAAHPSWRPTSDARVACFGKFANIIESTELGLKFLDEYLTHAEWWAANYAPLPSSEDVAICVGEFSQFNKAALVQLAFGAIESSLRVFLRALDSTACSGGTAEFKSIYDCLLRTKVRLPKPDDRVALLDLFRGIRNSIHNHGVYLRRDGADTIVAYRGTSYDFLHGKPIEFVTWTLVAQLVADVLELLSELVASPELQSIASLVDPAF